MAALIPTYLPQAIPAREVRVSQTTLFHLAARYLGDAMQWNRIAELNGISDPFIVGSTLILIPQPGVSDGGLPVAIVPNQTS